MLCILSICAQASLILVPGDAAAQKSGNDTVDVVLIYSHGCVVCERGRPVTMQALADIHNSSAINVQYAEYMDNSPEGLEYVERYHLKGVPSMVINGNTVIGPDEFQGDSGVVYNLIRQKVEAASRYQAPIAIDRRITRDPGNASVLHILSTIRNNGNDTVIVSFADDTGKAAWDGSIKPGASVDIAYNATVGGGIEKLPGPRVSYADRDGSHVLLMPEDTVPPAYSFDVPTLLVAGIIAGFNPCIIAILLFIAAEVAAATGKKLDIMVNVLVFCLGILAVYLLIGAGLFEAVSFLPGLSGLLKYAVLIILVALAAYAFFNAYLRYTGKTPGATTRGLIAAVKPLYTNYRLAGSFLLGGLFGMVKMPCAGGIYLAILSRIILAKELLAGTFYLLVFDVGVILPVLALGLLLAMGVGAERLEALRTRHAVLLHALNGAILILLAALFAFNVI